MGHPRPLFAWRSKFSDFLYKADPDLPVRTIKADGGGYTGPFHWDSRYFSLAELKRLQTIPDEYILVGGRNAVVGQLGNAVPTHLARLLAVSILQQIFGVELPFPMRLLDSDSEGRFRRRTVALGEVYKRRAADCIAGMPRMPALPVPSGRTYRATLTDKLGWQEEVNGALNVRITIHKEWHFHVSSQQSECTAFRILVEGEDKAGWPRGLPSVILTGEQLNMQSFTGVWKAFEFELCRLGFRADLVQLCGYQGYRPALRCSIEALSAPNPISGWKAVFGVIERKGVGQLLGVTALADVWCIRRQHVLGAARFLKTLGYEVRSHNTNKRIPEGHLLIPYAFPTLNPKSVQLYKEL
jgi:DNA (cytosine-5)-methyltransferase 1